MDGSMSSQQNLARFHIALIALRAKSNRLEDTSPLMPQVLAAVASVKPGQVSVVSA
jgi:hypothetical protein